MIPIGSKVILRHSDGSKIVAWKVDTGYQSNHFGIRDDAWIKTHGWHVESFEPPLGPLPTAPNSVVMFTGPNEGKSLAFRAFDGTWDMILSKGEAYIGVADPVAAIMNSGYARPVSFTEYVPKED